MPPSFRTGHLNRGSQQSEETAPAKTSRGRQLLKKFSAWSEKRSTSETSQSTATSKHAGSLPPEPIEPQPGQSRSESNEAAVKRAVHLLTDHQTSGSLHDSAPGHRSGVSNTSDAPEQQDAVLNGKLPTTTVDEGISAYSKAWSLLDEDQRKTLKQEHGLRELFNSLQEDDRQHLDNSVFRKGLHIVGPYLQGLKTTVDFVSPFVGVEPVAAAPFAAVNGVVTILTAICGVADNLTTDIGTFLSRIPVFERYSRFVKDGRELPDIYNALVQVYKDILHFYLTVSTLYKKDHFVLRLALNTVRQDVFKIISSFNEHTASLAEWREVETLATVVEVKEDIKDDRVDGLIRDTLDSNTIETTNYNKLDDRSNDACDWINAEPVFDAWIGTPSVSTPTGIQPSGTTEGQGSSGNSQAPSRLLVLFGDMGTGKTMTAAYVVQLLSDQKRVVCVYYCTDDQESTKLVNIYRSLLRQLLQHKPALKTRFWDWYQETRSRIPIDPTQSEKDLRNFLSDSFSSSLQEIFVIIDGLDECEPDPQYQLMLVVKDVLANANFCKAFISSRYDADIEKGLPEIASRLELHSSLERDRTIASHLANRTRKIPEEIRETVATELSKLANGSAIWLRIAFEYLAKSKINNLKGFERALKQLPSYQGLGELYWRLFEKTCLDLAHNADVLQTALEILAIAGRPMSLEELACATVAGSDEYSAGTMDEVEKNATDIDLLDLIQPFVSIVHLRKGKGDYLRLVHQSLKELVMADEPSKWNSKKTVKSTDHCAGRGILLHENLLKRCVRYLLLDDCEQKELFPSSDAKYNETVWEMSKMEPFGDDNVSIQSEDYKPLREFDPAKVGFGSFFAYAASFWTFHFADASDAIVPQDLMSLCGAGTQRFSNWVEQWRRPNCTYALERDFPEAIERLDPLVITAIFGSTDALNNILKCDMQNPAFLAGSPRIAVETLIALNRADKVKRLLMDETLGSALHRTTFFITAVTGWSKNDVLGDESEKEWGEIFDYLISQLRDDLLDDGNEVLCQASRNGCLLLVRKLFEAAEHDRDLRRAILADKRWTGPKTHWGPTAIKEHQSVGEAVWEGHIAVVEFLCQQSGIEEHLRYVNHERRTVFHQAARRCNSDMFRILVKHWPEGVDYRDKSNETALGELVFSNPIGDADTVESVKFLINEGKADASGLYVSPNLPPLCVAIRQNKIALCRVLVVEGSADLSRYLGVDVETGEPFLTKAVKGFHRDDQEVMLRALCQLVPLTFSMDYLLPKPEI